MRSVDFQYGRKWNFLTNSMIKPVDPAKAAQTLASQGFVTAKTQDAASERHVILEIRRQLGEGAGEQRFGVFFLDRLGRPAFIYRFAPVGHKLFLNVIREYVYPNDQAEAMAGASVTIAGYFEPDSDVITVVESHHDEQREEKYNQMNPDPGKNWEPMPSFGDWESLIRFER
jgi:hypothetical protein